MAVAICSRQIIMTRLPLLPIASPPPSRQRSCLLLPFFSRSYSLSFFFLFVFTFLSILVV